MWENPAGRHSNSWKMTTDSNFVYTYKEECPINYEDRDNPCNTTMMKIRKNNGILSWEKKIVDFKASSICVDDSYLYWGGRTTNLTDNNYRLVKADKDGNVIWTRYWNTTPSIFGESLALHGDHLYLVGVSFNETHPENNELSLLCYNTSGVQQWNVSYLERPAAITSICANEDFIYACGVLAAENEYGVNSSNRYLAVKWETHLDIEYLPLGFFRRIINTKIS